MTNSQNQLIVPPQKLVDQWADLLSVRSDQLVFALAAQWGADQELEACCKWMDLDGLPSEARQLRVARRPKPPSLKEQALLAIDTAVADDRLSADVANVIRCALEQLDD